MDTKITFRVLGVDFDDDATVEMIATHLGDLAWVTIDGVAWASLFIGVGDIVDQAIDAARRIEHRLQGAQVDQLDEELVAIPDISARIGVHRETIRSWVTGSRGPGSFPLAQGSLGGGDRGSMKVWRWGDVNRWLSEHYALGDGWAYPARAQSAEINAYLARAEYGLTVVVQNGSTTTAHFTSAQHLAAVTTVGPSSARASYQGSHTVRVEAGP